MILSAPRSTFASNFRWILRMGALTFKTIEQSPFTPGITKISQPSKGWIFLFQIISDQMNAMRRSRRDDCSDSIFFQKIIEEFYRGPDPKNPRVRDKKICTDKSAYSLK